MTGDTDDIEELQERARWFEDQGWSKQVEEIWDEIEQRESKEELSVRKRALKKLEESRIQEQHGDEIEELQERLTWYENRGWTSSAEQVRDELADLLE